MRAMKQLSLLFAMLVLALTMAQGAAAAQEVEADDPFDLEGVEGVQYGAARSYSVDFEAMMATPNADPSSMGTGPLFLTAAIVEFDNDDNAEKFYSDKAEGSLTDEVEGDDEINAEEFDVDLGNKSKGYKVDTEDDGMKIQGAAMVIQEGNYVYLVSVGGSEIDAEQLGKDLGQKLLDNDANDDEEQFVEDGTSTGGVWNKFPAADDEVLAGLSPVSDEQLYPEVED